MGYSKKDAIAKLNRERREAKAAKRRKIAVRKRIVRFLIVCEGTKTEKNYFEAFVKNRQSTVREETIEGVGQATTKLVERTLEIKRDLEKKRQLDFDQVWVVFDKDDFEDFNNAINLAEKLGFKTAWSNESFELWYYLHFEHSYAALGRKDYIVKLRDAIRHHKGYEEYWYEKGDADFYHILATIGNEQLAKDRACKLCEQYTDNNYAAHNPCTKVHLLIEELEKYQ